MILNEPVQVSPWTPPGSDSFLQEEKIQLTLNNSQTTKNACVGHLGGSGCAGEGLHNSNLRIGFKSFETFRLENEIDSFV